MSSVTGSCFFDDVEFLLHEGNLCPSTQAQRMRYFVFEFRLHSIHSASLFVIMKLRSRNNEAVLWSRNIPVSEGTIGATREEDGVLVGSFLVRACCIVGSNIHGEHGECGRRCCAGRRT